MLKIGLIGCGGVGAIHAKCWLDMSDRVRLVAIADSDISRAQAFADECSARVYADGMALIAQEELDVVDICLPTFLHADYIIRAMSRVKNVIVEKPVCLTEEETQRLISAQKETGAFVQVAHVVRFNKSYRYLKELVESGRYGKIVAGNFFRISPRPTWMRGHDDPDKTGTMTVDLHIHDADFVRWLMGAEPDSVDVRAVRDSSGIVQHIWSCYQYGGALLCTEGSWDYPAGLPFAPSYRVRLEHAAVVLNDAGVLTVYLEDGTILSPDAEASLQKEELGINVFSRRDYLVELQYFIDAIASGTGISEVSLQEAIASVRLVLKELALANAR